MDLDLTAEQREIQGLARAFARDEGPRYDPAAAVICHGMMLELFRRKLGEGDRPA